MALTSVASLPSAPPPSRTGWLVAAGILTGVAIVAGDQLGGAMGWVAGLLLPAAALVLRDFRLGVLAVVLLFPLSASPQLPRAIGGITGLNPLNLLLALTGISVLLASRHEPGLKWPAMKPLFLRYVLPVTVAGLIGSGHVHEIPPLAFNGVPVEFDSAAGYLRDVLVKPLLLVAFAVLVALAVGRSPRPERFLPVLATAAALPALLILHFVIGSGLPLHLLAGEEAREFLSPLGMHANDLGRLLAVAYALLLFAWAEPGQQGLRPAWLAVLALVATALLLTFSRSAYIGFALISLWYALTRRAGMALLTLLAGAAVVAALPGEVFQRLLTGVDGGANAVTAGRVEGIWLPLLPEVLSHPFFGNGLWSTIWSAPMREGRMLMVSHPHNAYLQLLLDLGLIGSLLVTAYGVHLWHRLGAAAQSTQAPALRGLFRGARVALVTLLVTGLSGGSFTPSLEQLFLWLAVGVALGMPASMRASMQTATR